ncbi:MAG: hypothetical protein M9899_08105 [Bdellovibrionaceae bacterium]|nr:hypothetical protein [Pseudobdellovibrionaceae bacterium]
MIISRYSIILLLLVYSVCSFAQTEKLKESKDLVPESIKKLNKIEYLSDESKYKRVVYTQGSCEPNELVTENGKKVYRDIVGSNKSLKYISEMEVGEGTSIPVEFKINDIHIVIEPGSKARFVLTDNCTKLFPVHFISGSDQDYLGVNLKKGNEFSRFKNNMGRLMWGNIDNDGYLRPNNSVGLHPESTDSEAVYEDGYYKKLLQCAQIKMTKNSIKGFYLLDGKRYDFSESRPNFWKAHSKYLGHKICSDQSQAKIDCEGTPSWSSFADDSIFGITDDYLDYATSKEEEESMRQEAAEEVKQAKIIGKKCDEAIAKYEKETGKKVKISPYYPERHMKNINKE